MLLSSASLEIETPGWNDATIKGIEVMRTLRKGQAESFYFGHPLVDMSGERSL
jgi:IS6 family transposase